DSHYPDQDIITAYIYDAVGRVISTTVGLGSPVARTDYTQYNDDNTIQFSIQNYKDGNFDPHYPDQDVKSTYGYDAIGRQIWVKDALGRYDVTHYDSRGRVDWMARNFVQAGWSGGVLPAQPPAYRSNDPDRNVATFFGYDGLSRTVLVSQTGILTGTF